MIRLLKSTFCFLTFSLFLSVIFCKTALADTGTKPLNMPKYPIGNIVQDVTRLVTEQYANLPEEQRPKTIQKSDENSKIFNSSMSGLHIYLPPDENYEYYFTVWYQAEENGVELIETLYKWTREAGSISVSDAVKSERPLGNLLLSMWMDNFISFPEDVFDTAIYEERALENVAEVYTTRIGTPAPTKLKLNPVSHIEAAWDENGADVLLNCYLLDFDVEKTEKGYTELKYFIDTSGKEDKSLWVFIKCEAREITDK